MSEDLTQQLPGDGVRQILALLNSMNARFDSMDAVREFAGKDESKPVIYPKVESLLVRMDERSLHYRIVL